jgi:ribosomal protein L7/L12
MGTFAPAAVDILLAVCLGIALFVIQARQKDYAARLERLERKMDLLLRQRGIEDTQPAPGIQVYSVPASPATNGDLTSEIVSLLAKGQKIEAIKRYREYTGSALKEARDAVDAIERRQRN